MDKIEDCRNTAVVLPRDAAMRFALQLSYQNDSLNIPGRVNIGKEKYFQQYFVFRLGGYISPHMMRRVKTIQTSGVMNWWQKIIKEGFERKHFVDSRVPHKTPTMDGNVLVIFAVWLGGLAFAFATWIWENKSRILYCIWCVCRFGKFIFMLALTFSKTLVSHTLKI